MAPQSTTTGLTDNPEWNAFLLLQNRQQAQGAVTGDTPGPIAPNPSTTSLSPEPTSSFDVNALMAPFQEKAEQLYGGNPVFGHSEFATNHPRLANMLSSGLIAASKWRTGPTTGDNIGNAAQMALAPEELSQQRAIQKAQYPAAMIGPQMEMALKGSEIDKNIQMGKLFGGAYKDRAEAQAKNYDSQATQRPISSELSHEDRLAAIAQRADAASNHDATRLAVAKMQEQIRTNPSLQPKLEQQFFQALDSHIQSINARFDKLTQSPIIDPITGQGRPRTQDEIDALQTEREDEIQGEMAFGEQQSHKVFNKSLLDLNPTLTRTSPTPKLPLPDGNGQMIDPFHARAFIKAVGGDPKNPTEDQKNKARALAKKHNWKF